MNGDILTIYDMMYEPYKITKPIRLISLFSGYDSQALALKYLGVPFEHYKTCEKITKKLKLIKVTAVFGIWQEIVFVVMCLWLSLGRCYESI